MDVKTFTIPDLTSDTRFYIAAEHDCFEGGYCGIGKAEGYWRSLLEARGRAQRFVKDGVKVAGVIKVSPKGREFFYMEEKQVGSAHPDFGSW